MLTHIGTPAQQINRRLGLHWHSQVVSSTHGMVITRESTIGGSEFDIPWTNTHSSYWSTRMHVVQIFLHSQPSSLVRSSNSRLLVRRLVIVYHFIRVTTDNLQTGQELRLATTTVRLIFSDIFTLADSYLRQRRHQECRPDENP